MLSSTRADMLVTTCWSIKKRGVMSSGETREMLLYKDGSV